MRLPHLQHHLIGLSDVSTVQRENESKPILAVHAQSPSGLGGEGMDRKNWRIDHEKAWS
jgi:hypothetical protein